MSNNISFIYGPKRKDPFTGEWNDKYLVPAVKDQQGVWNFIVVTCTPSMNGVYRWNKMQNMGNHKWKTWKNGRTVCYYIPKDECTFKRFDELDMSKPVNQKLIEEVKKQQGEWLKNEVKNRNYEYKKGKPDWML